jgi:hypothetical protein
MNRQIGGDERRPGDHTQIQHWHRRHAMQLATQMPECREDRRIILMLLRDLLDTFLDGSAPPGPAKVEHLRSVSS